MSILLLAGFTFQAMPKQTVMACERCTYVCDIKYHMHIRHIGGMHRMHRLGAVWRTLSPSRVEGHQDLPHHVLSCLQSAINVFSRV